MMDTLVPSTVSNVLLYYAAGLFVLGTIVWLEFIRIARPVLTIVLAAVGAAVGYFLPLFWNTQLADLTLIIIGLVLGVLLGAILFRFTQAVLFGILAAILCGGLVAWHDGAFTAHKVKAQSVAVSRGTDHAPHIAAKISTQPATTHSRLRRRQIWREIRNRYDHGIVCFQSLDKLRQGQVLAAAAGGLLVAILLGLLFPHLTSAIGGAWLGAGMIVWAAAIFTRRFDPGMFTTITDYVRPLWIYAGLGILGMAIQSRHILRTGRKKKKESKKEKEKKNSHV